MTTIHPLLRLRDSSKWRPGLRSTAKAAAAGSPQDLFRLIKLCDEEEGSLNLTQNERAMLFPILYRHLDPASIPSVADLDSAAIPDYIVARVNGVVLTLSGLIRPIKELKPTAAAPDLWPRVCPWLEFLHTYRGLFPNLPAFEEIELDGSGLRTIIAATWGEYVHEHFSLPHNKHNKLCMQSEALAMLTPETTQPGSLEQIIDGVGGSDDHLAALLIEHINQAADSEDISRFLDIGVVFLSTLPRYLLPTLLEHGMVRSLVSAMRKLQTHPSYLQECSTARSTAALVYFLRAHPRSAWISEALENGLLQFISQCSVDYIGPMQVEPEFLPNFERLLWEVLPRALVFYDVVAQMKFLLPDAEKLIATRTTQDYGIPAFAKQWTPFATLAKQRIAALEWWETSGRPFSQACDNMLCGRIDSRQKFRRCSGCAHATYCSRDCQRADWEAAHREICADFRSVLPDPYFPRRRDRGFAHILAGIDFQRLRRSISIQLLGEAIQCPELLSVVYLDYLGVRPAIARLSTYADVSYEEELEFRIQCRRAQQSGGRMQVHLFKFGARQPPKVLMFRMQDTVFDTMLRKIVAEDGYISPKEGKERLTALAGALEGMYSF